MNNIHNTYKNYDELLADIRWDLVKLVILCGLPGSGKSRLGEMLAKEHGYIYLSSDASRVEVLKLTAGKFASSREYVNYQDKVYGYMRDELVKAIGNNKKIVLDATHLNDQRGKAIDQAQELGLTSDQVLVVYVDGGSKENVRKRFEGREGKNEDGRSWVEAWETAYDFFVGKIGEGEVIIPTNHEKGYPVIWVQNY